MKSGALVLVGLFLFGAAGCISEPDSDDAADGTRDGGPGGGGCVSQAGPVTAVHEVPGKTKLDFLFMIDNSGSMCQEQANLISNFSVLSQTLFDELGDSADFRIAVINSDMRTEGSKGRFEDGPHGVSGNCEAGGGAPLDCTDLLIDPRENKTWTFGSVLKSGPAERGGNIGATREDLEHRFACLATLGTGGDGFEKGLEAMRLALSCEGPNKDHFAQCCVDTVDGDGQVSGSTYDPTCQARLEPGDEPHFLRPDAILIVVNLSDEVDCSDPASNPKASRRAICKYGPSDGMDADSLPDGYADPELCPGGDPSLCYRSECDQLSPEICYKTRCVVDRADNNNCEWHPEALTPVENYVDFLKSLKAKPSSQIIVASIVGNRGFVESNGEIVETSNRQGRPIEDCWYYDENGMPNVNVSTVSPECCPNGICTGGPAPTCESLNGKAFTGRRYLQLAEAFGNNGIGCPNGAPGNGQECVSICSDSFERPLRNVKDKLVRATASYCLDALPQCLAAAGDGPLEHCRSEAERADPNNYSPTVNVSLECTRTEAMGGGCSVFIPSNRLGRDEFVLSREASCASGLSLSLTQTPPAGATVTIEYTADDTGRCDIVGPDAGMTGQRDFVISPNADGGAIIISGDGGR